MFLTEVYDFSAVFVDQIQHLVFAGTSVGSCQMHFNVHVLGKDGVFRLEKCHGTDIDQFFQLTDHLVLHIFISCGDDRDPRIVRIIQRTCGDIIDIITAFCIETGNPVQNAEAVVYDHGDRKLFNFVFHGHLILPRSYL